MGGGYHIYIYPSIFPPLKSLDYSSSQEGLLNLVLLDIPISTIQSLRLLRSIKTVTYQLSHLVFELRVGGFGFI